MSFASPYIEQRSARTSIFYDQIDWDKIENVINRYYHIKMGKKKVHTGHVLLAIAYNLKRSPGIVASNSVQ